jgi:DNA-binding response OmpR family regulator
MAAGSGWNLSSDADQPSSLRFPQTDKTEKSLDGSLPLIVVVEDNRADIDLLRYALETAAISAELRILTDGDQAFKYIEDVVGGKVTCPVLFVLDLNLPKRSGRDVLQRLREARVCKGVPVVVFSSSDAEQDKQAAVSLGAARYITKPSNFEDFLKVGELLKPFIERT